MRQALQIIAAYAIVSFGLILLMMAFWIPPHGEIHPSVLAAFGEILTFAGSIIGIDYHYKAKQ